MIAVIVTVDARDRETTAPLEAHARLGLERFPDLEGFVSGTLHRSADGQRIVQYLQWESKESYQACIDSPTWDDLDSTREFMRIIRSGAATMDVRVYEVVDLSGERRFRE